MPSKPKYRIAYGFSYTPKEGPYAGRRIVIGPGEPVPEEILKDKKLLDQLVQAQKISIRSPNGEYHVRKTVTTLTEGQIDVLLQEGNGSDLNRILRDRNIARESLIRLQGAAEARNLPADVIRKIEAATMRE